jgi:uncharacterized membrane protein YvlD (DUF360 family)
MQQVILATIAQYWLQALLGWLAFAVVGTLVMYVGYGFAMAGKRARDEGLSQRKVVVVDVCIALFFIILDALLNLFVMPIVFLDFRFKTWFTLVTGRLCYYNTNPAERKWRLAIVGFFAAFLNGKDANHVKGGIPHFKWLD